MDLILNPSEFLFSSCGDYKNNITNIDFLAISAYDWRSPLNFLIFLGQMTKKWKNAISVFREYNHAWYVSSHWCSQ